ncbi:MAG: Dehydrogenase [Candidatus Angelobacter sp.]|jgi:3-oxoacyl-[acyl-carrier protein] reductase|nr:Dehydrogenase [Candidatus Angelobacter sp.]
MRLKNKVAFITGGARGLGRATALAFAKEGAAVAVCDMGSNDFGLANEIESAGSKYAYFACDVTKSEQVGVVVNAISAKLGAIDILVNNAGITQDATLAKMTEEQWNAVIGVNLSGVFFCTKAVVPGMIEKKSGKIINLSSVVGLYGNFGQTNYAATKSGVIGMTKTWARELGPKGINVNAVAPGFIGTEMVKKMPENVLESMKQRTPLRRIGEPQDIANACVFLASPEAAFINGAVLSVDGGLVL